MHSTIRETNAFTLWYPCVIVVTVTKPYSPLPVVVMSKMMLLVMMVVMVLLLVMIFLAFDGRCTWQFRRSLMKDWLSIS